MGEETIAQLGVSERCVACARDGEIVTDTAGAAMLARPIELAIPITVAGMSFGALSARVKDAVGRAATEVGTEGPATEARVTDRLGLELRQRPFDTAHSLMDALFVFD